MVCKISFTNATKALEITNNISVFTDSFKKELSLIEKGIVGQAELGSNTYTHIIKDKELLTPVYMKAFENFLKGNGYSIYALVDIEGNGRINIKW